MRRQRAQGWGGHFDFLHVNLEYRTLELHVMSHENQDTSVEVLVKCGFDRGGGRGRDRKKEKKDSSYQSPEVHCHNILAETVGAGASIGVAKVFEYEI